MRYRCSFMKNTFKFIPVTLGLRRSIVGIRLVNSLIIIIIIIIITIIIIIIIIFMLWWW